MSPKSATDRSDCTIELSSGTQRIVSEKVPDSRNCLSVDDVRKTSDSMTGAGILQKGANGSLRRASIWHAIEVNGAALEIVMTGKTFAQLRVKQNSV